MCSSYLHQNWVIQIDEMPNKAPIMVVMCSLFILLGTPVWAVHQTVYIAKFQLVMLPDLEWMVLEWYCRVSFFKYFCGFIWCKSTTKIRATWIDRFDQLLCVFCEKKAKVLWIQTCCNFKDYLPRTERTSCPPCLLRDVSGYLFGAWSFLKTAFISNQLNPETYLLKSHSLFNCSF